MSWWRRQPEVRAAGGYVETQLLDQFTRAVSGNVRHGALGGLQCAAGAVARLRGCGGRGRRRAARPSHGTRWDSIWSGMGRAFGCSTPAQGGYGCHGQRLAAMLNRARRLGIVGLSVDAPWPEHHTHRPGVGRPSHSHSPKQRPDIEGDDGLLDPATLYQMGFDLVPWRGRSGLAVAQSSGGLAATLVRGLVRGQRARSRA